MTECDTYDCQWAYISESTQSAKYNRRVKKNNRYCKKKLLMLSCEPSWGGGAERGAMDREST